MTIVVGGQNPSADEELLFLWFGWGGWHWRYWIRHNVSDLAGLDLVLRDTTRLAGIGLYQRTRASLELARAAGGDEDVTILAIELFRGFHS